MLVKSETLENPFDQLLRCYPVNSYRFHMPVYIGNNVYRYYYDLIWGRGSALNGLSLLRAHHTTPLHPHAHPPPSTGQAAYTCPTLLTPVASRLSQQPTTRQPMHVLATHFYNVQRCYQYRCPVSRHPIAAYPNPTQE